MDATSELQERGFVVIPGPTRPDLLANAYTADVASATSDDIWIGSTSTKVNDFVNRGAEFDNLYVFPPLLEACPEGQSDSGSERGRPTPVGNSSALVRPRRSGPPLAGSERRGRNECSLGLSNLCVCVCSDIHERKSMTDDRDWSADAFGSLGTIVGCRGWPHCARFAPLVAECRRLIG